MKHTHRITGRSSVLRADSGSILIFLIVLMVVFTALGVGMVSMFGSSILNVFSSNNTRRAVYMAESGLRYTISELRNAAASARETALANIDDGSVNGKWFNVFPGVSRYRVRVYPYYSNTTAGTGVATSTITTTVPNSGFPQGFAIPTAPGGASAAHLLVGLGPNNPVAISSVTGATPGSHAVTYTIASPVTIPPGMITYANLAFPTTGGNQTVTKGSALTPLILNINAVSAIAEKNGTFIDAVSGTVYDYQTARMSGGNAQLENINWIGASATTTFPANSYLIFSQSVRLESAGEHLQTQRDLADSLALYSSTSSMGGPPQNYRPPALSEAESGFSGTTGALDLTLSGARVVVQGYIATGGTHSYWAAFTRLGQVGYRFEDPEEPGRDIAYHVVPIADDISTNLRDSWLTYHSLNYDVQIKMGWDLNLPYAAQGIAFRWHESPDFHDATSYQYYQGYGITYMRYKAKNHGSDDMIPNTIKPSHSLRDNLLLVLWEQKVNASGVPTKDWLAYAELGDPSGNYHNPATERSPADPDQKVTGYQAWPDGRLNDNASIVLRVEDKLVTLGGVTTRYNDIKVFYGEASQFTTFQNDSRAKDTVATNKERARYYAKWLETGEGGTLAPINPLWPSNRFGLNGSTIANWFNYPAIPDVRDYDYFSLTSSAPAAPYNTVTWVKNNSPLTGFSVVNLMPDNCTIRTTDFTLDSYPSSRKEIGLVGMGDLNTSNHTIAFDDFYIQILGGY